MTNLLQTVLRERADRTASPVLDVDEIIRSGDRRVRRRKVGAGLASLAVAGAVAASTVAVADLAGPSALRGSQDPAAEGPSRFEERRVGYASGSVIHWGAEHFDVGRRVASYVQTDDGFVVVSRNGDVWLHDGETTTRIGLAANHRLRADDSGSLVGWVTRAEDGHPQYVVFDTGSGGEVARVDDSAAGPSLEESDRGAELFAVDDGAAFWRHGSEVVRYDVDSGEETVVATEGLVTDPATKEDPVLTGLTDVAAGWLAYTVDATGGWGMAVGQEVDVDAPVLAEASNGVLSPDGRFLTAEEEDFIAVYDTATRREVTPDVAGYPYAVGYDWVDADTVMVLGIEDLEGPSYPVDLLSCDIPDGSCDLVSEVDTAPEGLVLPVGDPMT
jgi:hypothetical protein